MLLGFVARHLDDSTQSLSFADKAEWLGARAHRSERKHLLATLIGKDAACECVS